MRNAYILGLVVMMVVNFVWSIFQAVDSTLIVWALVALVNFFIIMLGMKVVDSWGTDEKSRELP